MKTEPGIYPVVLLKRVTRADFIGADYDCIGAVYNCTNCEFRTNHATNFAYHRRDHTGELEYHCNKCEYFGLGYNELDDHIKGVHHSRALRECDICGESFQNRRFERHMNASHRNVRYECDQCDKSFTCNYYLEHHKLESHKKVHRHSCDTCDYSTFRISEMRYHKLKHSSAQTFKCDQCDKAFKHGKTLKNHIKTEHGNTPWKGFDCPTCGWNFKMKYKLGEHVRRIHEKKTNWFCNICPYSCFDKSQMKVHMSQTHGKMTKTQYPFQCKLCLHKFEHENDWINHDQNCTKKRKIFTVINTQVLLAINNTCDKT